MRLHAHIEDEWQDIMGEHWTEDEIRTLVLLVRAGHKPDRIVDVLGR